MVAYPQGTGPPISPEARTWNAGGGKNGWRCTSGYACEQGIDDVRYIRSLLADLAAKYPYEPSRVYSSGVSNGGRMSARLACEAADLIAAIADVAGPNQFAMVEPCAPPRPVPVLLFHGTSDPVNPYDGIPPDPDNTGSASVNQSLEVWRTGNGCQDSTTQRQLPDSSPDGMTTTVFTFVGCRPGADVVHYRTYNAGHTWPDGWQYFNESSVGRTTRDFSANEEMWSFLRNRSAPAPAGDKWYDLPGWPGRPYLLHTPTNYSSSSPPPLVLGIHGGGGNASSAQRITCPDGVPGGPKCLDAVADRETFLVAYASGTGEPPFPELRTWNAGGGRDGWACIGGVACRDNVDDIGYFHALLDHIASHHAYNASRVYSTGISNGAAMSERLACEMPRRIAAIAPVGGANQYATIEKCDPYRPVPVLQIHGVEDSRWPYHGGVGNGSTQGNFVSVKQSLDGWVARNGCDPAPVYGPLPDPANDGTNSSQSVWTRCAGGAQVWHVRIDGGGHTWPDGWQYLGQASIGRTSRDFSANELIWGFFDRWGIVPNRAPEAPVLTGPSAGKVNDSLSFDVGSTDPDGNRISYEADWGDGTSAMSANVSSGKMVRLGRSWETAGFYNVRARALDSEGLWSEWSASIRLQITGTGGPPLDLRPPEIVHEPIGSATRGKEIAISAKVIDDSLLAKVELHYLPGGSAWKTIPMLAAGVDEFSATIPEADTDGSDILYYLLAQDAAGNLTLHPAAGESYPHQILLREPGPDPQPPRGQGLVTLFAAMLFIAVVLAVAAVLIARRRGPRSTGPEPQA
jgi:polyhydroxybutyrate depolymerase